MSDKNVDRFDLEQQMLQCWNITSDLEFIVERDQVTAENIQALARIYEMKFDALWETFEQLVHTRKVI